MPAMIAASMPTPLMTRKWWVCGPSTAAPPIPPASPRSRLRRLRRSSRPRRADAQLADVDAAVAARQRDGEGRLEGDGQVEVAREEVAGARGQDAERHLRADEHARDVAHGAVTAERAHDVDAVAQGGRSLTGAGVLGGRLEEEGLAPTVRAAGGGDPLTDRAQVGELRRVDDDGRLPHRRLLLLPGAEVAAGWTRTPTTERSGRVGGDAVHDDATDDQRQHHDPGDDPRQVITEHECTVSPARPTPGIAGPMRPPTLGCGA